MKQSIGWLAALSLFSTLAHAEPGDVLLSLRTRVPLSKLAAEVSDPGSPRFGVFYTPEEIRAVAAPTDAEYSALLAKLKSDGLQVVSESLSHLIVTVRGDRKLLERATRIKSVESVIGLERGHRSFPRYRIGRSFSGRAPQPGILPAKIKTLYGMDPIYKAGFTGKGQHIAIATYDGFKIEDVRAYYTMIGLNPAPTVDQVLFNGTPAFNDGSAAETQLDAEFAGMIAPGAAVHVFASAENSDAGEVALFTAILDDNRAHLANYSWGDCEEHISAQHKADMDKVFARAVAQGVNILAASGDTGSDGCRDGGHNPDWPAAHANIVGVGGTSLKVAQIGAATTETGWKGSGGGVSTLYETPTWQTGISGSFKKRAFPDVAFNADPKSGEAIWSHYGGSTAHWTVVGGTSMASPQWVGYLALVNEAREKASKGTLPFLPSLIYLATPTEYAKIFTDITVGKNGDFSCGTGYDAVTGLGSMKGDAMHAFLSSH